MVQYFGMSQTGKLEEAVKGLTRPKLIMLMSNGKQFEKHVAELERRFPKVPSIGCIGMSYDTRVVEDGVGIIAFTEGVEAVTNVLEQVSVMPVKYIKRLQDDIRQINASSENTICIDFCSNNDACVLTTAYSVLGKMKIPLVGGTGLWVRSFNQERNRRWKRCGNESGCGLTSMSMTGPLRRLSKGCGRRLIVSGSFSSFIKRNRKRKIKFCV